MQHWIITIAIVIAPPLYAAVDPALAKIHTVFVEPDDPLTDAMPVASCVKERLSTATPLTLSETKPQADAVLRIAYKGRGSADLFVERPDGQRLHHLWDIPSNSLTKQRVTATDSRPCQIADVLLSRLRDAMRDAAPKKK